MIRMLINIIYIIYINGFAHIYTKCLLDNKNVNDLENPK